MKLQQGTFNAILITIGRKTSKEHAVELKTVYYNDKFYFSRKNPNSDWLKNAIANPTVRIEYEGNVFSGVASLVSDEELNRKISHLKYLDKRAEQSRVVLEVRIRE